jgi:photosystem II stability/assembly factor-like uncharacterized protein
MKISTLFFLIFLLAIRLHAQISAEFETDSLATNTFVASSFISDHEGWLADDAGNLWHTADGGTSWTSSPTHINFLKLDFTDAMNGFGLTSEAAYKTIDGGNSWSIMELPGSHGKRMYFLDASTGFISGNHAIYKTTDGGQSWTSIFIGGVHFLDYFFVDAGTGMAAAYDDDSTRSILRTIDGGLQWNHVYAAEDFFINAVWMSDENTAWAAGYYASTARGNYPAIMRSSDGGLTWENKYLNRETGSRKGEQFVDIRFRNKLEGYALSAYSESVYTIDGGQTWNFLYDESGTCFIPDWGIYGSLDGVNDMYLVGKNGYVTTWK